jgi:hypothetical protein
MSTFANNNDIVFAAARRSLRASVSGLEFVQQFSQSEHWEEAQMRAKMAQMRAEMEQMRVEMALMRAENEKLKLAAVKAEQEAKLERYYKQETERETASALRLADAYKSIMGGYDEEEYPPLDTLMEPFEYEGTEYCKNGLQQVYKKNGYILDYVGLYDPSTCKMSATVH